MKQAFRIFSALCFALLMMWNVSGLPVMLVHKSHCETSAAPKKYSEPGDSKIMAVGKAGDICQCALHIDFNHFSAPSSLPPVLARLFPPAYSVSAQPVLRNPQALITLFGSRAPPLFS